MQIPSSEHGLAYSLFHTCNNSGSFVSYIQFKDGTTAKCSDYDMSIAYSNVLREYS